MLKMAKKWLSNVFLMHYYNIKGVIQHQYSLSIKPFLSNEAGNILVDSNTVCLNECYTLSITFVNTYLNFTIMLTYWDTAIVCHCSVQKEHGHCA